jgi:hypothetical protein
LRRLLPPAPEARSTVQRRAEALDRETFFGVPIGGFDRTGRQQLMLLLMAGMEPTSKVVDLGCGLLRGGYWLIHFLDAGGYHGIEPHAQRIQAGLERILETDTVAAKRPRVDTNATFDTSVFGEKFDYFLAYSIWTHASKPQIETMLDSFLRDGTEDAVFLTSILPARWHEHDYQGQGWFGTSHESDVPGCIHHRMSWIRRACRQRNLFVHALGREAAGQTWLLISRDSRRKLSFRSVWHRSLWRALFDRLTDRARVLARRLSRRGPTMRGETSDDEDARRPVARTAREP